ncbi:MAG: RnfH family protein [Zoogloeaceae bacterium]|jgi:putative ubiquitin-RnfH superfamily antitoxin RatB of RatAB toxin-antitoxin module|nr:RnfH family protein [Zoogloeaceae bacterium]
MSENPPKEIHVEVIYALPEMQTRAKVSLPEGSTVAAAIEASGLMQKFPEIDLTKNKLGIYAKLAKADTPLRDHDRVEIYRPLIADPKEIRKRRAAEGKVMKAGAGGTGAET